MKARAVRKASWRRKPKLGEEREMMQGDNEREMVRRLMTDLTGSKESWVQIGLPGMRPDLIIM